MAFLFFLDVHSCYIYYYTQRGDKRDFKKKKKTYSNRLFYRMKQYNFNINSCASGLVYLQFCL